MEGHGAAVVLGCRGMLGSDLVRAVERSGAFRRIIAGDWPEADITDAAGLRRFLSEERPAVIFNCAAMTDVDGCERDRERAFAVNAIGAEVAAAVASERGSLLIHLSTDYVFDGRKGAPYMEEDGPAPLSTYGRSKLEGERRVAARAGRWAVARTSWLYGSARENVVDRMVRLARTRGELSAVSDLVGSPTWSRDLAEALVALARAEGQGIFHIANRGACSRYEQAQRALACAGIEARLSAVSAAAFPRPAAVPHYSALDSGKFERATGHLMRPWQDALCEYVRSPSGTPPS